MYIYLIQNLINNKVYVGQTCNFKSRIGQHKRDAFKRKYNYPLYNSMRKYGFDNFKFTEIEIVDEFSADDAEVFYIKFFK